MTSYSGSSSATRDSDSLNYLPAALSSREAVNVGNVSLKYDSLRDGRCLYNYTVEWEESAENINSTSTSYLKEMGRNDRMSQDFTSSSSSGEHHPPRKAQMSSTRASTDSSTRPSTTLSTDQSSRRSTTQSATRSSTRPSTNASTRSSTIASTRPSTTASTGATTSESTFASATDSTRPTTRSSTVTSADSTTCSSTAPSRDWSTVSLTQPTYFCPSGASTPRPTTSVTSFTTASITGPFKSPIASKKRGAQGKKELVYKCDGQCRKRHPIREMTVFGLCEHVICRSCMKSSPRVGTTFGGEGCPNSRCYLLDMAAICPDKNKRITQIREAFKLRSPIVTDFSSASEVSERSISPLGSTMSSSDAAATSPLRRSDVSMSARSQAAVVSHLVTVIVALFRSTESNFQFLQKNFFEFSSHSTLSDVLNCVFKDLPEISRFNETLKGRCFLGPTVLMEILNRQTWIPISQQNLNQPLFLLENKDMKLALVIDMIAFKSEKMEQ